MNHYMIQFRDALRGLAAEYGVSFVDFSKCRCWAEPFIGRRGLNLSADGPAEIDDEDDNYTERESWTMFGDLSVGGKTIGLLLMANGYLAVEMSNAAAARRSDARRAWLAHHRIDLLVVDATLVSTDPIGAARNFFELVHERAYRARRSSATQ